MKSYTDINQSKQLAEILPLESADMSWVPIYDENHMMSDYRVDLLPFRLFSGIGVPCWSLTALERLMPFQLIENNNRYGFYQVKGFNKQGETYRFGYKSDNNSFLFETSWSNNPIDAAFEMICWLKENNKI